MKRIGQRFAKLGEDIDYLHCSADENSLDGVILKNRKIALIDGTSPHITDPVTPGAVDKIINLGEFWNEEGIASNKEEIREIARKNNLKVANKPDSEDICFIPDGNYKKFLENNSEIKPKEGNIVNSKGEVLGKHTGLYNYTIGQRKGLGISYAVPLFVLGFNKEKNEVIVGEEKELYKKEITVKDINLLLVDEIKVPMKVEVKTRYSSKSAKAEIVEENNKIKVVFDEPQRAMTPGQSAVFYVGDIVLGGGKIESYFN